MEITLNRHIEITPGVRSGKPRLAGTRITVADVAIMYLKMGQSLEEIAGKYQLSLAAVYAAIAFYYDNKALVDRQIQDDEAFVDAFMRNNPSRLQEKLKALRGE
ncbi:MAG: DUF433 domain-containing protein [Waterburya sp.]